MGFGDCLDSCAPTAPPGPRRRRDLHRAGRPREIAEHLSAADVGLCPDAKTPLNDVSTMNKTMEYMAYALPSVCFDLTETRVSGGDTVRYAPAGDVTAFTDHVERLLDDEDLRVELGLRARTRVCDLLDWRQQADVYVSVFRDLLGAAPRVPRPRSRARAAGAAGTSGPVGHDDLGRAYVDLRAPGELEALVRHRGRRPTVVRLAQPAPEIMASTPR